MVDSQKLRVPTASSCLAKSSSTTFWDPAHEVGRHKARVFRAALGIHRRDWAYLRDRIREGVAAAPVHSVRQTSWGRLYEVIVPVVGRNGRTCDVMTVWLVVAEGDSPRFVTRIIG